MTSNFRLLLLGLTVCVSAAGCNRDRQWPARPITVICPWSAGGGTDRVSRQIAVQLEGELGVPVNVINATGGGGVTGHTRGATAPPDGYTLTMATVELNMLHWHGLCPITPDSFRPLAMINQDSAAIFVRADSSWQSINELEQAFRESAESIPVSGTAAGGIWHLALVGWLLSQGVPIESANWISINGSAPSLQELMAGGVEVVCCSIPEAGALLEAKEVRCLGVMSEERCPAAPQVPTFREQQVDWSLGGWRGLAYPNGVAEDRAERMEAALLKVAGSDEFARFMNSAGFNISIADGATFASFLAESDKEFGDIITQPALQGQDNVPLSPYFLPGILAVLAAAVSAIAAVSSRRSSARSESANARQTDKPINVRLVLAFAGGIALFIVCCNPVGYVLTAGVLLTSMLLLLRVRLPVTVLVVIVLVPGLYQVFAGALRVPLPWGWWGW